MIKKRVLWALLILTGVVYSCTNIMELSEDGQVGTFKIRSFYPNEVQLGEPRIADRTILIPFNYGIEEVKANGGLIINSEILLERGIKIRNLSPDSIIARPGKKKLEGSEEEIDCILPVEFFVESESGMVRKHIIQFEMLPRSRETEIIKCLIKNIQAPNGSIVSDSAVIDANRKEVKIFLAKGGYPISFEPVFTLSDTAHITNCPVGTRLEISYEEETQSIQVESASGNESEWKVSVRRGIELTPNVYVEPYIKKLISLSEAELKAQASEQVVISSIKVDDEKGLITLIAKNTDPNKLQSDLTFPIECNLDFPVNDPRFCVGYKPKQKLVFSNKNDLNGFYLYHSIRNYNRHWQVAIAPWKSEDNLLKEIKISQYTPAQLEVFDQEILINHISGAIVIPILGEQKYFPLKLTVNLKSNDPAAKLIDVSATGQSISFANLRDKQPFVIEAENGEKKTYTLSLRYKGELNKEADIESFRLLGYTSTDNRVKLADKTIVDKVNKTIQLEVLDWVRYFPLKIKTEIGTSFGATMTPEITPDIWITFNDVNTSYPFRITSEDGNTTSDWRIILKNSEPQKNNEAELLQFSTTSLEGGYSLTPQNGTVIDYPNRRITLYLLTKSDRNLSFVPNIKVSNGAKIEGFNLGEKLTFVPLSEEKRFSILSESENTRNQWTIKAIYAPQLVNNDFENGLSNWASANNSFVSGTSTIRVSNGNGVASGNCVQLKTGSAVGFKAAGSLFLGRFAFNMGQQSTPKKMTYFGIPFSARPNAMSVALNYRAVNTEEGPDKASIVIQLLRWRGSGDIVYHEDDENKDKIDVIGQSERLFLVDNGGVWKLYDQPIQYNSAFNNVAPTHINVVFSSSYRGDVFVAGVGSTLLVDNVKLHY